MTKQTKTVKSYGTTSHAKRALKAIGIAALQAYDKLVTINENGRFEFILEKAEAIQEKADSAKDDTFTETKKAAPKVDHSPSNRLIAAAIAKHPEMVAPVAKQEPAKEACPSTLTVCPKCGSTELYTGITKNGIVIDEETRGGCHHCDWEYNVGILRTSVIERPCKLVWHIADEMVGARRKDVLAACVARGVAFYTARTQYQLWLSTKNGTAK